MKQVIFAALFLTGAVVMAKPQQATGVIEYTVKSAKYAEEHVKNAGAAGLRLDYTGKKVSLHVEDRPVCNPGMACPRFIRMLNVELSITSVTTDDCGIRHVTALEDQRPVDGIMQQITVSDPSKMTCKTLVAVDPQATYETAYVDRRSGKSVDAISKMVLSAAKDQAASSEVLLKFQMGVGFSPDPMTHTLTVDSQGKVVSVREYFRSKRTVKLDVAQLSKEVLANLKKQLATVPADAKLTDESEGQPQCMDAPSSSIVAMVDGQEVTIYTNQGCHVSKSYEGEAVQLANVVLGLSYLVP